MNNITIQGILEQLNALQQETIVLQQRLNTEINQFTYERTEVLQDISSSNVLGEILNQERKALSIDLASLSLQTGVSLSTLQRLFKDPSNVKFDTVLQVVSALGGKLCLAK